MIALQGISWRRRVVRMLAASMSCAGPAAAATLSHFPDTMFHDGMEGTTAGPFNDADAARFLAQATFGPTDADIAHLRTQGYQAWLTEQFAATATSELGYVNWVSGALDSETGSDTLREAWFLGALGGPDPQSPLDSTKMHKDQLRQRVAFALSEVFVVSDQNTFLDQHPPGLAYYYDILSNGAFGNFRTLLEQVTLSPEMGVYLNMLANQRADLSQNLHPDENYAREINQLFSVGLVMLNEDGTPKLSAGQPIPTYNQATITAFAHVFTGWNWSTCPLDNFTGCGPDYQTDVDWETPMAPNAAWHDDGTDALNDLVDKQLLAYQGAANGGLLLGNQGNTPQSDLKFALDNIFNHPNIAPFIGKQLIQRLVTSNPSPAYVQRISNVFKDDGSPSHLRGNLKAVITAILLDPEARYGQWQHPDSFGKLREPLLRLTHFWRAMGAVHSCGQDVDQTNNGTTTHYRFASPYRYAGYSTTYGTDDEVYGNGVAQAPLNADTVFNFFKPSFMPAGEMTQRGLLGPEFQISTDTIITNSTNNMRYKTYYFDTSDTCDPGDLIGDVTINRTHDMALAGSANGGPGDPANKLVDAYNVRFMSGQMSPFMRQVLLTALNPVSSTNYDNYAFPNWQFERISKALLLIINSPEYMTQK